jgi:hypothetical protein
MATVCGAGFCIRATSKKPRMKAVFASGPDEIMAK